MRALFARLSIVLALAAALPALAGGGASQAGAAANEAAFDHSIVRLIDGGNPDGERMAGVDIRLKDGWKTYWRVPGDAGTPPVFDWSKSENLASATVLWPAPKRYFDPEAGEAIGYKHRVVFPVRVRPKEAGKPVILRLSLDYALCKEMCIPAHADLERTLPARAAPDAADAALLAKFIEQVPVRDGADITVAWARMRSAHRRPELVVALKGEGLDEMTEIYVEGPPLASFCHPRFISAKDGLATYFLPVDGITGPDDLKGETLTLTIISSKSRVERRVKLP